MVWDLNYLNKTLFFFLLMVLDKFPLIIAQDFFSHEDSMRYGKIFYFLFFLQLILFLYLIMRLYKAKREDIKRAEKEYRFRKLTEKTPLIVFQILIEGDGSIDFLYISDNLRNICEYSPEEIIEDPDLFIGMIHDEDYNYLQEKIQKNLSNPDDFGHLIRLKGKDKEIWAELNLMPSEMKNGAFIWDGYLIDITDKKMTERHLSDKSEQLEHYFSYATDLLCIADTKGRFIKVNKEWEKTLGYEINELEGESFLDFVHPDDLEDTVNAVSQLKNNEKITSFTNRYRSKDGNYRYFEWRASAIDSIIYANARDISERMEMEKRLKGSLSLLDAAIESTADGILVIDNQDRINIYNGKFIDILNIPEELLKSNDFNFLIDHISGKIKDKEKFQANIKYLKDNPHEICNYFLILLDGRVYETYSQPQIIDSQIVGRVWSFRDITERKRVENALRKSQELLDMAMKVANDGIWDWNLIENKVYFDSRYFTMAGYEPDEFPHSFHEWRKRVYPEHIKVCEQGIEDYLNGKTERFDIEFKFLKKDNNWMWIRGRGKGTEFDKEGRVIRFVGTHSDISKRKAAEEELEKERKRLNYIIEGTNAGTWEWNIQTGEAVFNEKWAQISGYTLKELEPVCIKTWKKLFYPGDIKKSSILLKKHFNRETGFYDCECRIRHKSGKWVWVQDRGKISLWTKDGRPLLMQGIHVDISARKRAEFALKENEEKLRTLFSSMTEMVALHEMVFDDKGRAVNYRITGINSAYCNITGMKEENILGKLATEIYGNSEPPYLVEYSKVAQTGKPIIFETYNALLRRYLSISAVSPGKNKFATITNDITDLKNVQQALKEKNKELEQIVYVASHDLRSPLVNIEGYSRELEYFSKDMEELIKKGHFEKLQESLKEQIPDVKDALFHIRNSTKQMDKLLKGLLKLSRSGRAALNIIPLDMNKLVLDIVSSFDFIIKEMNLLISIGDLPSCIGDEVQITQVVSNLIENAIKFLDPKKPGKINITGRIELYHSIYRIEDNGIGIDIRHQDKIFELFHRLSPDTYEGEGLGLTIARQIISRLNGSIRVESQLGKGSCFYISLPNTE